MSMQTVTFDSHGVCCEGWWLPAGTDDLTTARGRPAVVMAHGFGCTRDGGLLPFAERFAAAGLDVLVFDYRGFGTSGGELRQDVDHRRHREDYHAAIAWVRARDGVDPARVAVWGTSYSGGHVVAVAARDQRLAAVVSQGAAMDGLAAVVKVARASKLSQSSVGASGSSAARAKAAAVVRDAAPGGSPVMLPLVGPPGSTALFSAPGAEDGFAVVEGPTFRNEMRARGLLRLPFNRPVRMAADVACPMLVIVAENDEIAPAESVRTVARRAPKAETLAFPCRHFEIYVGEVFERSVAEQVGFLRRVLA